MPDNKLTNRSPFAIPQTTSEILTAVERATAAYDWPAVFELVSTGLAHNSLTPAEEFDLRFARLLPNWFLGDLDGRFADLAVMVPLARETADTRRLVTALHELHWTQHLQGDYAQAQATIEEAFELVQTISDAVLEARTLNFLGTHAREQGDVNAARKYHQSALALSREGVSPLDESWALEYLALMPPIIADPGLVDDTLLEALTVARDAGILMQEMSCLNTIGGRSRDFARKRRYKRLARDLAEKINFATMLAYLENYMGFFYWQLGLYGRAARHAQEAVRLQRHYKFTRDLMMSLDTLAWIALSDGDYPVARSAFEEIIHLIPDTESRLHWAGTLAGLGEISLKEGQLAEAADYLNQAAAAYAQIDRAGEQARMLATLALIDLENDDPQRALDVSAEAISLAAEHDFVMRDFPLQDLWWLRYQVLDQVGGDDEEAWQALEAARLAMFEPVINISDEGLRRNYLNKPPVNRSISESWTKEAARRGFALNVFTEREATPASLAEQLERIVASGERLAVERETEQLATVILQEFVELSGVERAILAIFPGGSRHEPPQWAVTEGIIENEKQQVAEFSASSIEQASLRLAPVLLEAAGDVPRGELPELHLRSVLALPLVSQGKLWGVLYGDMRHLFGRLNENDRDILSLLANQAGAALENANWVDTLERQVADRTAEAEAARGEAETARIEAEHANQAKSAFMSNMSHELRTPLNAIIGFTRIVRRKADGRLPEKQIDNLDKVLGSSEHLLGLINTVLDIAKIEAGRMEVNTATFSLPPLIGTCTALTQPLLKPDVKLITKIDPDLPPITSDQDKLKQILLNLLSNAAKFTHQGSITVSALQQDHEFSIQVADTGIGMSAKALENIFEEFQQAESTTSRDYGGTGLGLSISKRLAQLLGGDLTVQSVEQMGTTFTLTVPHNLE